DTGIGINQENLSKVFDEFTQAEAHTARKFGGTGLGLTISRKMDRLLQGDITVTSKEGVGSTFSLTLPIRYVDVDGSEA
ncbi:MAG: ATP-binding protein, partial [Planctomycetales bacterium]